MTEFRNYWRGGQAALRFLGGAPALLSKISREDTERGHARQLLADHFRTFLDRCHIRVSVEGQGPEPGQGCVLCHNESSFVDIGAYFQVVWPYIDRLAGADIYRHIPFARAACRKLNLDLIARGNRRATDPLVDSMVATVQTGGRVGWGAEGRLSGVDGIAPVKIGGSLIAIRAQAPIIPIVIHGGHHVMPLGTFRARAGEIRVRFCDPVPTVGVREEDARAFADDLREVFVRNYNDMAK